MTWIFLILGIAIGAVACIIFRKITSPIVGQWTVTQDPEKDIFSIVFTEHPGNLYKYKEISFRVKRE